jgi:hypothetical protein
MDSASPDPRARTQPRPRKTVSASPDPGLGLNLDAGRRTPPRPTLGLEHSLDLGRRSPPRPTQGSDSTSTSEDGLDLDLGGASASPDLGLGPTTSQGGIITLPLASSGYGEQDRRPIWLALVNE